MIPSQTHTEIPRWTLITTWIIVNLVCVIQAVGFISRVITRSMETNHLLGYGMFALGIPAIIALMTLVEHKASFRYWFGLALYLGFLLIMLIADYLWQFDFRNAANPLLLIVYLVLFFASIIWMGVPMYRISKRLWGVTLVSSLLLMGAMGAALVSGLG